MTTTPFTIDQLIMLAKIGSNAIVRDEEILKSWMFTQGILPTSTSKVFNDVRIALYEHFPDGVIGNIA